MPVYHSATPLVTEGQGRGVVRRFGLHGFGSRDRRATGALERFGAGLIHFSGDIAFGTIGNHTGPGNGWCFVDTVTCVNPHAGLADVVITTTVGIYSATQKFQINLQ